jgi:hypothetical protein
MQRGGLRRVYLSGREPDGRMFISEVLIHLDGFKVSLVLDGGKKHGARLAAILGRCPVAGVAVLDRDSVVWVHV